MEDTMVDYEALAEDLARAHAPNLHIAAKPVRRAGQSDDTPYPDQRFDQHCSRCGALLRTVTLSILGYPVGAMVMTDPHGQAMYLGPLTPTCDVVKASAAA